MIDAKPGTMNARAGIGDFAGRGGVQYAGGPAVPCVVRLRHVNAAALAAMAVFAATLALASCGKAPGAGKAPAVKPQGSGLATGKGAAENGQAGIPRFTLSPSGDSGEIIGFGPGASILLRFDQETGMPLAASGSPGNKADAASKKVPWAMSVSGAAVSASGGRAAIAVNRMGVLFIDARPGAAEGGRVSWSTVYDKALFGNRTIGAFWRSGGRLYAFLYSNEAFSPGTAAPGVYSLGDDEKSWRSDGVPAAPGGEDKWVADYLAPTAEGDLVIQYHRGVDTAREVLYAKVLKGADGSVGFSAAGKSPGRVKRIRQEEFLSIAKPGGKSKMKKELASLCDPEKLRGIYRGQDEHVETMAVYAIARSSSFVDERSFLVDGAEEAEWSATLSVWGWPSGDAGAVGAADATAAAEARMGPVVLYPDGSVLAKAFSARMPEAGEKSEYRFMTVAARAAGQSLPGADYLVATWAEEVFPEVGAAGIGIVMAPVD